MKPNCFPFVPCLREQRGKGSLNPPPAERLLALRQEAPPQAGLSQRPALPLAQEIVRCLPGGCSARAPLCSRRHGQGFTAGAHAQSSARTGAPQPPEPDGCCRVRPTPAGGSHGGSGGSPARGSERAPLTAPPPQCPHGSPQGRRPSPGASLAGPEDAEPPPPSGNVGSEPPPSHRGRLVQKITSTGPGRDGAGGLRAVQCGSRLKPLLDVDVSKYFC